MSMRGPMLFLGFLLGTSTPAYAEPALSASYEISWLGTEIGRLDLHIDEDADRYAMNYEARTVGLFSSLFDFSARGSSHGSIENGYPKPSEFAGGSRYDDRDRSWRVAFDDDGRAVTVEVDAAELAEREPVPDHLKRGPDPLTLALKVLRGDIAGMKASASSFDGKRVIAFDLSCGEEGRRMAWKPAGLEDIGTVTCAIDGRLLAGGHKEWSGSNRAERQPVDILMAADLVEDRSWPLRVTAHTRFGAVQVKLVEIGGQLTGVAALGGDPS